MYAKMAPKMVPNRTWRRLGAQFLRFWKVLGVCLFSMSFGMVKKSAKNHKSSTFGRPKAVRTMILGRPGRRVNFEEGTAWSTILCYVDGQVDDYVHVVDQAVWPQIK